MPTLQKRTSIGIDLAAKPTNPTGWARWKEKGISTCQLYYDKEILEHSTNTHPRLIAVDVPLRLPTEKATRKADREMYKRG